jgi:hypothetical protein
VRLGRVQAGHLIKDCQDVPFPLLRHAFLDERRQRILIGARARSQPQRNAGTVRARKCGAPIERRTAERLREDREILQVLPLVREYPNLPLIMS